MSKSDSSTPMCDLSQTVPFSGRPRVETDFEQRQPEAIGRYQVERILGKGGFGVVYLARDEQLDRNVAIKLPYHKRMALPEFAAACEAEARTVAGLDHPHIVPVYDVGNTDEYPFFVVSKYISGSNLAARLKQSRLTCVEAAELIATIAEALHAAHEEGIVHRDVKPGNILIEDAGKPWLVDFGLAMREREGDHSLNYAGTSYYMSPEQARGEGHRVDRRSDVFSLGVVFYEILAGHRPFSGNSTKEVLQHITRGEIPSLDDEHGDLPGELVRICHKAMARRVRERYVSAHDFAADLRRFLDQWQDSPSTNKVTTVATAGFVAPQGGADGDDSSVGSARVVPKGLRSFDERDADFFLDLLPGPRDRQGLPEAIRFWKQCVEQREPNVAIQVGVIYGPSGCGKSSLVKAGLLPRLPDDVCAIYSEATSEGTEAQLLRSIQRRVPGLASAASLFDALAAIRKGSGLATGEKLVMVIDQFEQWLHAQHCVEETELVRALRQCDGTRVQCILMVRDEFWLALSRFMQALEISLEDGHNSALVDLFHMQHAKNVLAAFGVAYERLPSGSQLSAEEEAFLEEAVTGLSENDRVICVRLALFADMMKNKPWTLDVLRKAGGTTRVAETFLEETFSASTARPQHRHYAEAARAVLRELLPKRGTAIKGQMKSRSELLQASGFVRRPGEFDTLIRMLDGDLRLVSPVDVVGENAEGDSEQTETCYQLAHDYLVEPLWAWLSRKQQQTYRGRAEIRLAERAALWNARPETQQLPGLVEYLNIGIFTQRSQWDTEERKLMSQATRYHLVMTTVVLLVVGIVGVLLWQVFESDKTRRANAAQVRIERESLTHVNALRGGDASAVPQLIERLNSLRPLSENIVRDEFARAAKDSVAKLHLALAMMPYDDAGITYAARALPDQEGEQFDMVLQALRSHSAAAAAQLWQLASTDVMDADATLQAANALAQLDPVDSRWEPFGVKVADQITQMQSSSNYIEPLLPISAHLVEPLQAQFDDKSLPEQRRQQAAIALCDILSTDEQNARKIPEQLVAWIVQAESVRDYRDLLRVLRPHAYGVQGKMRAVLAEPPANTSLQQRANAAAMLLHVGDTELVESLLRHSPDPTLRSLVLQRLMHVELNFSRLAARLFLHDQPGVRQAFVLLLGMHANAPSGEARQQIVDQLARRYFEDTDAGVHSAIRWTMTRWQLYDQLDEWDSTLGRDYQTEFSASREWTVNSIGQTLIRMSLPDATRDDEDALAGGGYQFAVSSTELTLAHFQAFRANHTNLRGHYVEGDCPVHDVSWYDAAAFCNWLSVREGLTPCYLPNVNGDFAPGMRIPDDVLQRSGYRLPTVAEAERMRRAGTITAYSFGDNAALLRNYAWFQGNSAAKLQPAATRLPNAWGIFDSHGSLWEWTQELQKPVQRNGEQVVVDKEKRILTGGAYDNVPTRVRSGEQLYHTPDASKYTYGFRPVRTLP